MSVYCCSMIQEIVSVGEKNRAVIAVQQNSFGYQITLAMVHRSMQEQWNFRAGKIPSTPCAVILILT